MPEFKEKKGSQLKLFSDLKKRTVNVNFKRRELDIYFNKLRCRIKQIAFYTYRDGYEGFGDFVSLRFCDDKSRCFSMYGFKISKDNGNFCLVKPKGVFVEGSLWKEIEDIVIEEYSHRFSKKCYF